MNIRQGAFRIWVVVTVLWIGLVGWSHWDLITAMISNQCWHDNYAWHAPAEDGKEHWMIDGCENAHPHELLLAVTSSLVSLPGGLLAIWFVGAWVWRASAPISSMGITSRPPWTDPSPRPTP
jgi:hypothetical protein